MLMYDVQKLFKENEILRDCSQASTDQDAIEVLLVEMSYDNFFGRRSKVSQAHFRFISEVLQAILKIGCDDRFVFDDHDPSLLQA